MSRKLQIILRLAGLPLLALAAILFIIGVARTMQTEEHATADGGFVIQHRLEVSRTTYTIGLARRSLVRPQLYQDSEDHVSAPSNHAMERTADRCTFHF